MNAFTKFAGVTFAIGATTASLAFATPAFAQAAPVNSASIRIVDIDQTTAQGQRLLSLRIKRAAIAVCASGNEHLDAKARRASAICTNQVTEAAYAGLRGVGITTVASR